MQTDYCSSDAGRRWPITDQMDVLNVPEPSIYEQLHSYLYDYHFGRITFLELLDKWKEVLRLPTAAWQQPHPQHEQS